MPAPVPHRYTVTLVRRLTMRVDVLDSYSEGYVRNLIEKEGERLLDATDLQIESCTHVPIVMQMVRDAPRGVRRISDDGKRITDEEVNWEK